MIDQLYFPNTAAAIMDAAQANNQIAHSIEETGGEPSIFFERKHYLIYRLGLEFGADIKVERQGTLLSITLKSDPSKQLHIPKNEIRLLINKSRLGDYMKHALRQTFLLNPGAPPRKRAVSNRSKQKIT